MYPAPPGRRAISEVLFYLDYKLDESYTPKKISICCGTTFHDLREVRSVELHEPNGWVAVSLTNLEAGLGGGAGGGGGGGGGSGSGGGGNGGARISYLRAHFVQVSISSMHQSEWRAESQGHRLPTQLASQLHLTHVDTRRTRHARPAGKGLWAAAFARRAGSGSGWDGGWGWCRRRGGRRRGRIWRRRRRRRRG